MYLLYSLLLTVGFIALTPKFAIDALRSRKYITGLRQRLGKLPQIVATHSQHATSREYPDETNPEEPCPLLVRCHALGVPGLLAWQVLEGARFRGNQSRREGQPQTSIDHRPRR